MMREHSRSLTSLARGLDLSCIIVAFLATEYPLGGAGGSGSQTPWPGRAEHDIVLGLSAEPLLFLSLALLTWVGVAQYMGVYRSHRAESLSYTVRLHFRAQFFWIAATGFLVFVSRLSAPSRSFFLWFYAASSLLLTTRQIAVLTVLHELRRRGFNLRRAVVLGNPEHARRFADYLEQKKEAGYQLVKLDADDLSHQDQGGCAVTSGTLGDFDEAFIMAAGTPSMKLEAVALKLLKEGKRVHLVPGIFDATLFRRNLDEFAGIPVLSIGGQGMDALGAALKRTVDIVGALGLIVMLSPLFVLTAIAVKLASPGPIFFVQERLGKGGNRFRLFKFRTMCQNAEAILKADPALYKKYVDNNYKLPRDQDPRIGRLGCLLRSTSLDELPQLFNVLRGDMSLVGPRPIVPSEIEKYNDYAHLFVSVKPGLTGYWQVSGRSEISDYGRRAALDMEYIRDQSLKTDVAILLKTIPAVLRRRGAH